MTEKDNSGSLNTGNGKNISWPVVALVALTGGGNWLATHSGNVEITAEQREGLRQMHDLHSEIDDFKRWQRMAGDNQRQMMENDSKLLTEVHRIAVRLERLKNLDQERGAPQ